MPKRSLVASEMDFGTILGGFSRDLDVSGNILGRIWHNKLQNYHKFDTRVGGMAAATKLLRDAVTNQRVSIVNC